MRLCFVRLIVAPKPGSFLLVVVQTEEQRAGLVKAGGVPLGIGRNAVIRRCIVDKNARIGEGVQVGLRACALRGVFLERN